MKLIKLKKSWLRDPVRLLYKTGLVYQSKTGLRSSIPSALYLSKKDIVTLKSNLKKRIQKSTSSITAEVEFAYDWLQYGPNESLQEAIKPGYALIDIALVNEDKKDFGDK